MAEPGRLLARGTAGAAAAVLLSSCGLFDRDDDGSQTGSVFDAEPGMCFAAQEKVKSQVSDLEEVACSQPHAQEAYAVATYTPVDGESDDTFPGEDELVRFADGACAQEFADYVGIEYLDSRHFFTYLLPSPRSWEEDDREVLCLVTTTGKPLTESVKGSAE